MLSSPVKAENPAYVRQLLETGNVPVWFDKGEPGAHLIGADLRDANLKDANLTAANLEGADLAGANLKGAIWRKSFMS